MFPLRFSTLEERKEFYEKEFDIKKTFAWLPLKPQILAVDMGSDTKIIKNKAKLKTMINIRNKNVKQKLINYEPEDVYYDRNIYKDPELCMKKLCFRNCFNCDNFLGQELAFDIDPENIPCDCKSKYPNFCNKCLPKAIESAFALADYLKKYFRNIKVVYSGRGAHVHIFDKKAYKLTIKEREEINKELKQFHIDPWVSRGYIRLIRLPYSLNALVSRIVIPLKEKKFNPLTSIEIVPAFLKK